MTFIKTILFYNFLMSEYYREEDKQKKSCMDKY